MTKRCAVCGKFQKSTTEMIMNGEKMVCPACAAKLNLVAEPKQLIEAGKRGVTKHQMIPAIEANYNDAAAIKQLAAEYPTVFHGSIRYLHKKARVAVEAIINVSAANEEKEALDAQLQPKRKGVTYHQIINAVKAAAAAGDKKMITLIKKYYGDLLVKSAKYLRKDHREFAGV